MSNEVDKVSGLIKTQYGATVEGAHVAAVAVMREGIREAAEELGGDSVSEGQKKEISFTQKIAQKGNMGRDF